MAQCADGWTLDRTPVDAARGRQRPESDRPQGHRAVRGPSRSEKNVRIPVTQTAVPSSVSLERAATRPTRRGPTATPNPRL
eukprot:763388-Prymnesium_polylepis.1